MASASNIYDAYGLKRFFPLREASIDQATPELRLHYLVIYQKVQAEADWLVKFSAFVAYKEPNSLLTPLHLCAMLGDHTTCKALLTNPKVSVAEQDVRRWTSLHHAALLEDNEKMISLLLEADKAKSCGAALLKNQNEGTYLDLRLMAYPVNTLPNVDVFSYRNAQGEIVRGNAAKFQEMTGARFTQQMCANPSFFRDEWARPTEVEKSEKEYTQSLASEYQKYRQNPTALYIDDTKAGKGVFALEDIQVNTIVVVYLGEASRSNASLYALELCDGAKVRNLGPMVNDGFPNCVDIPMGNVAGFPLIRILRTTQPVSRGEQLLWNYGIKHPVKKEQYINLIGRRADLWFRDKPILKRYDDMFAVMEKLDMVQLRNHQTYFHYFFSTPSYQISLLIKRIVEINDLLILMQQPHFVRLEGEMLVRAEVGKNIRVTTRFFDLCKRLGSPTLKERSVVDIVEYLFSKYRASLVVQALRWAVGDEGEYHPLFEQIIKSGFSNKYKSELDKYMNEFEQKKFPEV
jgi:hypothetical protein